ncbi:glycosyltransferase family 2 protein [Luteitalea sp. TBR-22]|uniref:glycosyltransferase family 2 protein n=1 Tax=Luteitalea sp. TBR-22 TaxID=2802971 RepID=UPI001EF4C0D0|nr:glycosyltransferase family 2 protein [Luteitalea sp. TBR-22]
MPEAVSIIIPVYNEEGAIASTLGTVDETMRSTGREYEVLVVDDGSADGTATALAAAGARVVRHRANRGYGAALKTGIRATSHPLIAILDADGTYPIARLPDLLQRAEEADMVVGARTGGSVHVPALRRPVKWLLTRVANVLSGHRIPDLNSGMRVFRRDLAERFFGLYPQGFSFTSTITLASHINGYRVEYVPIDYYRRTGASSIRPVRDTLNFFLLIVRMVVTFRPLNVFLPTAAALLVLGAIKAGLDFSRTGAFGVGAAILILTAIQVALMGLLADLVTRRTSL